ncbi:hypothetical protein BJ742DRAFT_765968 [Cladochytrium replicatum]|nr:hypothetical protein BJ742DRAFT_765968 [Cladochytrium replicatum]
MSIPGSALFTPPSTGNENSSDSNLRNELLRQMPRFDGINNTWFRRSITPGQYIMKKHKIGQEMYYIVTGWARLDQGMVLQSAAPFTKAHSLLGVLFNVPRTASIRTVEDCVLMVLTRDSSENVLQYFPTIAGRFRDFAE